MSTTFEEAKKCPRCDLPGEETSASKGTNSRGQSVMLHMIFCRNDKCNWYNTSWVVQVNPDGSIPDAYSQVGPKRYPTISPESETRIQEALQAQLDAETRPGGGEVRNPFGGN